MRSQVGFMQSVGGHTIAICDNISTMSVNPQSLSGQLAKHSVCLCLVVLKCGTRMTARCSASDPQLVYKHPVKIFEEAGHCLPVPADILSAFLENLAEPAPAHVGGHLTHTLRVLGLHLDC